MNNFDDFLALSEFDFSKTKLIVFSGKSGSGKSTCIKFLLDNHFKNASKTIINSPPFAEPVKIAEVVVLDEALGLKEYFFCLRQLHLGKTVVVASHLPSFFFSSLAFFFTTRLFNCDCESQKLARYLAKRDYSFSEGKLHDFQKKYKATFTDLEIILETSKGTKNFDMLFDQFEAQYTIDLAKNSDKNPTVTPWSASQHRPPIRQSEAAHPGKYPAKKAGHC